MLIGFTNGLVADIDTRNVLSSLQTKSANYQNSIKSVFVDTQKFDDAESISMNVSEFAMKTLYMYHIMSADGAFSTEANTLHPILLCLSKISKDLTKEQMASFKSAADNYNGAHWYFAGKDMAALAKSRCVTSTVW
jgi:hypothetical protein